MKSRILIITMLCLLSNNVFGQTNERVDSNNKWFFGLELGLNTITSIHPEHKNSFQGGVLAEYYFAPQWSVSLRMKYLETGIANVKSVDGGVFDGAIISVPINIKWEYRIVNNFKGNLKLGAAFNQEVKSNYDYPSNESTDYSKFYVSLNLGFGFDYFISESTAFYLTYESYILGNERNKKDFFDIVPNSPTNNLFSIGIKHNFGK